MSGSLNNHSIERLGGKERSTQAVIAHEWLVNWGGSESVLQSLKKVLPNADIHTLVYQPDRRTAHAFSEARVLPSVLNRMPLASRLYPYALPFMPRLWLKKDIGQPDLIVSSSHAFSKAARAPGAFHLCYCHTPPRYLWDLSDEYTPGMAGRLTHRLRNRLRAADLQSAHLVDYFVANSKFVADRILRTYGRKAEVLYPPVDTDQFTPATTKRAHFLAGGRLVRYKRIDYAIRAANTLAVPLVVFGDGPDRRRLESLAGPTVHFTGPVDHPTLVSLIRSAWAFLYPGIEDFGILPVEVQAAGTPVIARAAGGALESVKHKATGLLYDASPRGPTSQVKVLSSAMLESMSRTWSPAACRDHAEQFSRPHFERGVSELLKRLGFVLADGDSCD
jgi:glycosyltransferase involved in cell wall biosynthesis